LGISGDVTVMASMASAVQEAKAHFGKSPWGLVNCAGVMHYQYVADVDVEVLCIFFFSNFFLTFLFSLAQLCGGHALPVRGGRGCGGT